MERLKKVLSLLLTVAMIASFMVFPASAEETCEVALSNENVTVTQTQGQDVTVSVNISGLNDGDGWGALTLYAYYDDSVLTFKDWNFGSAYWTAKTEIEKNYSSVTTAISAEKDAQDADKDGNVDEMCVGIAATATKKDQSPERMAGNGTLWTLTFTVKAGLESQKLPIKLVCLKATVNENTTAMPTTKDGYITVNGVTPTLSTVALNENTVTVDGTNGATVNAKATSAQGTILTEKVTWSVAPTDNGVSIDATNGTITVGAKAKAGNYTITAKGDGATATGSANATLEVARAAETYTVTVTPKSMEMTVPASDENKGSFSATVTNQYDETMTEGVMWSIAPNDNNVSINSSTGEVTVKAAAKDTIQNTTGENFTVTATYGENKAENTATLTVKREASRVSSIELAENAKTTFEVPTVDKTDHEVPEGVNFPAVTVKDQYGEKVSAAEVTWTLGSDKPDGVSVDANDKLVISSSVAANDGFADNKLEFTAIASYGGVSKEVTLTLTRELSTATSVEISGGKSEFTIPVDETADKATYTAVVKDQYGQPVTGDNATVTWSITPSVTGVNFDNGAVSVTKDAKSGTTSSQEFTVTAKCGNAEDTETFTVERAESVVTAIEYTGNTNVVVPDGNSTNECAITLTFKDQYGTEMTSGVDSNNLEWICPKGIMVETGSGTYNVKVSKDALKHFGNERKNSVEVKITAKYGDLTKEIPVTLNLANAVATTVQLNGDNSIMIPKTVGSVNTKTYTVTVFDQYGFELPDKAKDATYTFTAADANVTCTGYGSDNESKAGAAEVKVSYGATAKSYTLVATVESKDSTAKTIEVKDKTEDTKTLKVVQNNVVFGTKSSRP